MCSLDDSHKFRAPAKCRPQPTRRGAVAGSNALPPLGNTRGMEVILERGKRYQSCKEIRVDLKSKLLFDDINQGDFGHGIPRFNRVHRRVSKFFRSEPWKH